MPKKQMPPSKPLKAQNIFGQPLTIFGLPVERDVIFADHKGNYKKSIEKQQRNGRDTSSAVFFISRE